ARGESESGERIAVGSGAGGRDFEVLTNRPVRFRLLSSSDRIDKAGDLITVPRGTLAELPPIVTVLRFPRSSQDVSLKVQLHVEHTDLGTLDIHLLGAGGERFKLAFDLRGADQAPATPLSDVERADEEATPEVPPENIAAAE